ncbi:MAG: class I SAM-dependent methyltransferase [Pseudomonadota bacterium]
MNSPTDSRAGARAGGLAGQHNWRTLAARAAVRRVLAGLQHGLLTIREEGSEETFGNSHARADLHGTVEVVHPNLWLDVMANGALGAGEAYMKGHWTSPDLTAVVRAFCANLDTLSALDGPLARAAKPVLRGLHWLNRNTEAQARRNIAAHYDLGNDMFRLFLDPTMMYSSAIYPRADSTLDEAAVHKLDVVCRKLDLQPGDHLLEIGTGWGGLAVHAAKHYGCRVTTTTISKAQHAVAVQRALDAGVADRITFLLDDYRDLTGCYDKLVSIEMIEAVGHAWMDTYFGKLSALLKPDGLALVQAITIADQRYEQALKDVDFIQRYIFPGGFLPSVSAIADRVARCTDMAIVHLEDIGLHYARTLQDWRARFFASLTQVRALGYDDTFVRMWDYYLCYCEGGFRERVIGTGQVLMAKPRRLALT